MTHLRYILELPKLWSRQSESFKSLINTTNDYLGKKDLESKSQAMISLFELVYGAMEYLEADSYELAKTQRILNNPRVKSYEDQLLQLMLAIEELCQIHPELAIDRYMLYFEVLKKLLFIDLDGMAIFNEFISRIYNKLDIKRVSPNYINDYIIFSSEFALLSFETKNIHRALEIFLDCSKPFFDPAHKIPSNLFFVPFLGVAICYEHLKNYVEASNVYFELLNRFISYVELHKQDEIPSQLLNETIFYGYITSFLAERFDRLNLFYSFSSKCESNIANFISSAHSMAAFGFSLLESFKHTSIESLSQMLNHHLRTSYVRSSQINNSSALSHIEPINLLLISEAKTKTKNPQRAILIVQTQHLKDIQVIAGKITLPSLNVLPDIDNTNYVIIDGIRFNISSQFAFGTSFSNEIEIIISYQKKPSFKKKFHINDKFPPLFVIDVDSELSDVTALKEGHVKHFDVFWHKDMVLIQVIKALASIDLNYFTNSNLFFKEFVNLTKKLNLKEIEKVTSELAKQDSSSMIIGKALKLVLLQRLSDLEPGNAEIIKVIEQVAGK